MSEKREVVLTCDYCGKAHDRRHQIDDAGHQSWFRIGSEKLQVIAERGSYFGTSSSLVFSEYLPRDPDLCSWECVERYAQRQAEMLAAQMEAGR